MKLWNNYIGKKYIINNPDGKVLQVADLVIVHPPDKPDSIVYAFIYIINDVVHIRLLWEFDTNDDKLTQDIFECLEPVSWWTEENRTIKSPIFESLAALLNIKKENLRGMPGYFDNVFNSPLPEGWLL